LEWSTIVTIVLGSSFLGAVLTNLVAWQLKRTEHSSQATYLALNLAHIFEQFTYACLSAVEDHETAKSSKGCAGKYVTKLPEFPKLPDYDYRVFDLTILDKIFDFPQKIGFASESLSSAFEVMDDEDASKEGYRSCLELARESLSIADSIRKRYGLAERSLRFGEYSVRDRLDEESLKVKK
jgi:hypothetical protein